MKMGLTIILLFLFTSPINIVNAQQQIFKNYTVNDGLVSNSIRRIFQDSKGFLWIGTMEGLSKYDGNNFTNYTTANGLSQNVVNDFCEPSDGRLYVALNNGSIDEITNDKITLVNNVSVVVNRFIKTPWQKSIVTTDINGFQNFGDGKLIKPVQDLPQITTYNAIVLSDTSFVAASDNSLFVLNKNYKLISEIKLGQSSFAEMKIYKDAEEKLWVVFGTKIKLISKLPTKAGMPVLYSNLPLSFEILNHYHINDIFEDEERSMWFATTAGIVKISEDGSHQIFTIKDGLTSNIITSIFQDNEKNIWFGTAVGLSKLVTKSGIRLFPIENGVWANDNMFLLYPFKKDHFLVSTFQGTKDFNKVTGAFSMAFKTQDDLFYHVVSNTNPPIITGLYKSITFDTDVMQPKIIPKLSFPSKVRILVNDKSGNSFAGNIDGLFFNTEKGLRKIYDYRISSLLIDQNNYLWAGTWSNGIVRLKYEVVNNVIQILETKYFLPNVNVRSLYEDTKGNIWVGSRYNGVFRLTQNEKDSFETLHINQSTGLTSNFVKGIREDANGNFWIAFFQGLDKLIPQNNNFHVFNFSKVTNFFTSVIGMEIDNSHFLWLATEEGIVRIKDGELEKLSPFPVYITKVFSSDSIYTLHSKKLKLNYWEKDLQLEFSSPSYINEKQIFYSYRLSGNNEASWSNPNNNHSVSYVGLEPGKYQFQVKSLGWNSVWGTPAIIDFEITPPFWKTWWFTLAVLIIIVSVITALVRRRIKVVKTEAKLRSSIVETEMMALRAQMNPHFIFNCINSIDALIQNNDKYHATIYLNKFAKLIRNILDSSKQNTVSLTDDLDTLKLYIELEQFRYEDKFIADIEVDNGVLQDDYKIPPLIVQPFVENAIQHGLRDRPGKNGKLTIRINKTQNDLQYIIEDNGVGREMKINEPQKEKKSYGISMSSERVRLFNKEEKASVKIEDLLNNNKPSGTRVVIRLNIQSC